MRGERDGVCGGSSGYFGIPLFPGARPPRVRRSVLCCSSFGFVSFLFPVAVVVFVAVLDRCFNLCKQEGCRSAPEGRGSF